jgi:hypothetical protein
LGSILIPGAYWEADGALYEMKVRLAKEVTERYIHLGLEGGLDEGLDGGLDEGLGAPRVEAVRDHGT